MKVLWCWRCEMDMPMLDEQELALIKEALENGMEVVERERRRRGMSDAEPLKADPRPLVDREPAAFE